MLLQVAHINMMFTMDMHAAPRDLVVVDMSAWTAAVSLNGPSVILDIQLRSLTAHDLYSLGPGVSQLLLKGDQEAGIHHRLYMPSH